MIWIWKLVIRRRESNPGCLLSKWVLSVFRLKLESLKDHVAPTWSAYDVVQALKRRSSENRTMVQKNFIKINSWKRAAPFCRYSVGGRISSLTRISLFLIKIVSGFDTWSIRMSGLILMISIFDFYQRLLFSLFAKQNQIGDVEKEQDCQSRVFLRQASG